QALCPRACCVRFFFSSRRRHTRFSRDWSSDVCSSDLRKRRAAHRGPRPETAPSRRASGRNASARPSSPCTPASARGPRERRTARSEERRVGKECRARWWAQHYEKNETAAEQLTVGQAS